MFILTNPNPIGAYVEDCVVRAISIVTGRSWDDIFIHLCLQGYIMKNMPSVNKVWERTLILSVTIGMPFRTHAPIATPFGIFATIIRMAHTSLPRVPALLRLLMEIIAMRGTAAISYQLKYGGESNGRFKWKLLWSHSGHSGCSELPGS